MSLSRVFTSSFGADSGVVYAAAPVIADSDIQGFGGASADNDFDTSNLDVTGADILAFLGWNGSSAGFTSFSGLTDDTSSSIDEVDTQPRFFLRDVAVVGSKDATWRMATSSGTRPVIGCMSVTGLDSVQVSSFEAGSGSALPSHSSMVATGGPKNIMVLRAFVIFGAHETNPATVPAGHTLVMQEPATANDPSSTARVTVGVASREYGVGDLSWDGSGEATIPAATWGGLDDIGTQNWRTVTVILKPA